MVPGSDLVPGLDMDPAEELVLVLDSGLDPTLLLDPVLSPDLAMVSGTVLDRPIAISLSSASLHSMRVADGSFAMPESSLAMLMSLPPMGFSLGYGRADPRLSV